MPAEQESLDAEQDSLRLIQWFGAESYLIALSGGVDSAVVAKAAVLSGRKCLAVTAQSSSVARQEMEDALRVVEAIGIAHQILETHELESAAYRQNDFRRCYHCKSNLFSTLRAVFPNATLLTGTNLDDLGDYRPGLLAAGEAGVRSPLAELGISKARVRALATRWNLPIADKPASPCLASRLAYGVEVTHERLARIEGAERVLRELGLIECRVRLHADELARIEVPESQIERLASATVRGQIRQRFQEIGFHFVTLDLNGFRSGSLNQVIPLPSIQRP